MLTFKKILCPTDFSSYSYKALSVADDLAKTYDSEVLVLHVIAPVPLAAISGTAVSGFNVTLYTKELERSNRLELDRVVSERFSSTTNVRGLMAHGTEADEIVNVAEEEDVDLIVIATHGMSGLKRLFMGSVAEKVLRHTLHPILMIPMAEKTK